MADTRTKEWTDDDCIYCAGATEVLAFFPDGGRDYIPCPECRHRLGPSEAEASDDERSS